MLASSTSAASGTMAGSTASATGSPCVLRPRAGLVRIGSGFATLASLVLRPPTLMAGTAAGSDSVGDASVTAPSSAALRVTAAFRSARVYWFQWGLHIRPNPSFWLGWAGKSLAGASCASIPNFADPMHFRMSAMSVVLSLAAAHLAFGSPSITLLARRCKVEDPESPDDDEGARQRGPDRDLA